MFTLQLCVCVVPLMMPWNLSLDTVESHQVSATVLAESLHRLTSLKGDDDDDRPSPKDRKHDHESGQKEDTNQRGDHVDGHRRPQHGHGQAHEKSHGMKKTAGHPRGFGAREFHKPGFGFGGRGFSPGAQHAGPKLPFMPGPRPFHNTGSIAHSFARFHGPQHGPGLGSGPISGLVFELLDLNHDGSLSREEFQRLIAAVDKSHPRPPQHDGPQVHGPQVHGMPGHGPDGRAEGPKESHGFGPRPPVMHGFRPEHGRPRPEFRRPEMDQPESHESKDRHHDPSSRGPRPGQDGINRDRRNSDDARHEDDHRGKNDQHDEEDREKRGGERSRDDKRSEKPLSNTRPQDLPHHVLPFDWI